MTEADLDLNPMAAKAQEVAALLKALANEKRLLVLCRLAEGEATVTALADEIGLSQSATSQHLARMRAEGLISFRRDAQTIWYRIADAKLATLLETMRRLYCEP